MTNLDAWQWFPRDKAHDLPFLIETLIESLNKAPSDDDFTDVLLFWIDHFAVEAYTQGGLDAIDAYKKHISKPRIHVATR